MKIYKGRSDGYFLNKQDAIDWDCSWGLGTFEDDIKEYVVYESIRDHPQYDLRKSELVERITAMKKALNDLEKLQAE